MNLKSSLFFTIFFVLIFGGTVAYSIDLESDIKSESDKPINIDADSLVIKNEQNLAIFKGNVVVKQGKINLESDEMEAHSRNIKGTNKSEIEKIYAKGSVKFSVGAKEAYAEKALYKVIQGKIELTENVKMKEGGNLLQGNKFVYDVKTGKSNLMNQPPDGKKSSTGKVRAVIIPDSDEKPDFDVNVPPVRIFRRGKDKEEFK